jgi:hypothetical protein
MSQKFKTTWDFNYHEHKLEKQRDFPRYMETNTNYDKNKFKFKFKQKTRKLKTRI